MMVLQITDAVAIMTNLGLQSASACFLYDDVSIQNFSEYMIRGCTENFFLPWRIANRMTPECMGIALMGWIFLVSYMMYHFRNWQGGMEHGAEDWADAYDVAKRRANPDDTKNRVLSANVRVDTQGDRKLSNNNMIVIGSSGTYKTTSVVTPNLLQANENYIILDVKGELLYKYGLFLKSRGYTIRVLNLKEQNLSDCYNPFDYIENELDLIKLIANIQAACNPPDAVTSDPFWHQGAALYLQAVFYYEWFMARREGRPGTFNNVLTLLNEETSPDTNVKPVKGQPQQTVLQSVAQIKTLFSGDKWQTIMDNCASVCLAFASQTEARFNGRRVAAAHWKFATSAKRRGLKFSDLQASPRGGCGVTLLAAVPPLPRRRRGRDGHAQVHLRPPREHDDRHGKRHGSRPGGRRIPSEIRRPADDAAAGQADEAEILHHSDGRGAPDLR